MNTILDHNDTSFEYILADGKSIPYELLNTHRADCCSARAVYRVTLNSGNLLFFCNHHFNVHSFELHQQSKSILDESKSLLDIRTQGSAN